MNSTGCNCKPVRISGPAYQMTLIAVLLTYQVSELYFPARQLQLELGALERGEWWCVIIISLLSGYTTRLLYQSPPCIDRDGGDKADKILLNTLIF